MASPLHKMMGPPGERCSCGASFDDYASLAEHVRLDIKCPRCGALAADQLAAEEGFSWQCGHWIARGDFSATLREAGDALEHYPTYGPDANHVACACGHTERIEDNIEDSIEVRARQCAAAIKRVEAHVRQFKVQGARVRGDNP